MLVLLIILDMIQMIISTIVLPILLILSMIPCVHIGRKAFESYENAENWAFKYVFGMSIMDAKGFFSQRKIL